MYPTFDKQNIKNHNEELILNVIKNEIDNINID